MTKMERSKKSRTLSLWWCGTNCNTVVEIFFEDGAYSEILSLYGFLCPFLKKVDLSQALHKVSNPTRSQTRNLFSTTVIDSMCQMMRAFCIHKHIYHHWNLEEAKFLFLHTCTVEELKDWTKHSIWSKTTLITRGGEGVDPPSFFSWAFSRAKYGQEGNLDIKVRHRWWNQFKYFVEEGLCPSISTSSLVYSDRKMITTKMAKSLVFWQLMKSK